MFIGPSDPEACQLFSNGASKRFLDRMSGGVSFPKITSDDALHGLIIPLNIPHTNRRLRFGWNGKRLSTYGLSGTELIHEGCHWIAADPDRRCLPEFGLGPGFNTFDSIGAENCRSPLVCPESEEVAVCMLSAMWEFYLGFSPFYSLEETGFVYDKKDGTYKVIGELRSIRANESALAWLVKRGLATEQFEPIGLEFALRDRRVPENSLMSM